jgi:AAHS family 4-hydroxybenzoate transporter-like MFS transporter
MDNNRSVNVTKFIDSHPFSAFQWLIFAVCFVIVLLDGFDTAAIGYIAPSLIKEWGVTRSALGPVLSAALFGLAIGALVSGPLADRFGRKHLLFGSVLIFGAACLGSSFSANLDQLTVMRFLTGMGLGAAMPNAVTLMSEFCPERRRNFLTNAMFCGFPLGAALGGFLAAWIIPNFGWRGVLVLGGTAPLLLAVLILFALPESLRFMVLKGHAVERVRAVLARISPEAGAVGTFELVEPRPSAVARGAALVVSGSYIVGSVMLWTTYFMGLVIFYALINWMPLLFKDAGVDPKTATLITALFPLGGFGAIFSGWLMDRFNGNIIVGTLYGLTALFVYAIGLAAGASAAQLMAVVFIGGALMNTAQSSMGSLAAAFYPTEARATGVAWMLGVGRFGGIAGSLLVAELARRNLGFGQIFAVVAIPGAIAMAALLIKQFVHPHIGVVVAREEARAH